MEEAVQNKDFLKAQQLKEQMDNINVEKAKLEVRHKRLFFREFISEGL